MFRFVRLLLTISAAGLVASCQTQVSAIDGSGYEQITMKPDTRKYIVANDIDLARQIVAHNEFCAKQPGCRKAAK